MTLAKKNETFLAFQPQGLELLKENLAGIKMAPWDMDKATIPTGGGTAWQVPDLEDGTKSVKALTGIILHWAPYRAFYFRRLDEGGEAGAPDCQSNDGVTGYGDPGGDCESCEWNQWDSGKNGGKACPEHRRLFLLQPDAYLPLVVQLPVQSVKPLNQYLMRLASRGISYNAVVTSFALEQTKQRTGGITYSRAVPSLVRHLTEEEKEAVKGLAFRPAAFTPRSTGKALNDS